MIPWFGLVSICIQLACLDRILDSCQSWRSWLCTEIIFIRMCPPWSWGPRSPDVITYLDWSDRPDVCVTIGTLKVTSVFLLDWTFVGSALWLHVLDFIELSAEVVARDIFVKLHVKTLDGTCQGSNWKDLNVFSQKTVRKSCWWHRDISDSCLQYQSPNAKMLKNHVKCITTISQQFLVYCWISVHSSMLFECIFWKKNIFFLMFHSPSSLWKCWTIRDAELHKGANHAVKSD